jgi:hypothetical protein
MNLNGLKMKIAPLLFVLLLATSGCLWRHHHATVVTRPAGPIVTPDITAAAKVIAVNTVGRFVVLSFPGGQLPKTEQTLFLYRDGLKVAELRVTGPQSENHTVADIVSGEAQVSDAVRDQ